MEEHEPFIAAIEAQPNDHTTRLVYADWLDERDNPAGEYLRTELRLASLPEGSADAPDLRAKLRTLRPRIDPTWLARFDQPRVMLANPTPFPAAWWGIDLPGREAGTYGRVNYDELPSLRCPQFNGTFDWLPKPVEEVRLHPQLIEAEEAFKPHLTRLVQHLTDNGLTVPADFLLWLTDLAVWRIPSCTGCSGCFPWDAALVEGPPESRVVPFYIDSQGCITWYLYLTPDGYHAVVATYQHLCSAAHAFDWPRMVAEKSAAPLDGAYIRQEPDDLVFVAPSVEAFFYRWWFENTLWHKGVEPRFDFHDPTPSTPEEQAYLNFYRKHSVPPA